MATQNDNDKRWREILSGEYPVLRHAYHLLGTLPAQTRCKNCKAPFDGPGGRIMLWLGRGPYRRNPRFCES